MRRSVVILIVIGAIIMLFNGLAALTATFMYGVAFMVKDLLPRRYGEGIPELVFTAVMFVAITASAIPAVFLAP